MVAAAVATVAAATATVAAIASATASTTAAATPVSAAPSAITAMASTTAITATTAATTAAAPSATTATTTPPILGISTGHPGQTLRNQHRRRRQNCADGHCEHKLFNVHIVLRLCGFVGNVKVRCCRDRTRSRGQ